MPGRPVYFDNAATTPMDPRVWDAMRPYFLERFGNPSSRTHLYGWEAEEGVEQAREEVAALLGAEPSEILFTSGATEANNLALKGILRATAGRPSHLITSAIEHSAILDPAQALEAEGFRVTRVLPDAGGRIDPAKVEEAWEPDTVLVSVMHGNNEIGVLQDLAGISRICAAKGALLHTDATQSAGKVPCRVRDLGVHLLSCSAHKIYGPKGAGALYVRRRDPHVRILPLLEGGGQERGLRSGTPNVPAIVGFGKACALAREEMESDGARVGALRDRLETGLLAQLSGAHRNGQAEERLPGISNLHFERIEGEALMLELRDFALSGGSACASASLEPSHVLLALGLSEMRARNSIRFSLGRFNTEEEVDRAIAAVCAAVGRLRRARGETP